MNRRKFLVLCPVLIMSLYFASSAFALLAQEPTQLEILALAKKELERLTEMIALQKRMLNHLSAASVATIQTNRTKIQNSLKDVKKILQSTDKITHMTSDLALKLQKRHPEWKSGLTINQLKSRNDERDKGFKGTAEAYLKAANKSAENFAVDNAFLEAVLKLLNTPDGQTQAIQMMGSLLDNANTMIVKNEQTIQGLMTTFLEFERDEMDKREQMGRGIVEACGALKQVRAPGSSYSLGL